MTVSNSSPVLAGVPRLNLDQVPAEIHVTRGICQPRTVVISGTCPAAMHRLTDWRVEDFLLHKQLYKGKASLLYSATCRLSGLPIALKLYRKNKLSNLNWFQVEREIRIHSQLRHRHIVRLYAAFEDSENVYLAQEFASGGDLYEDLKANGGRVEEARVAAQIIYPCMQALAYLHSLGIIHRDIKSENILLAGDGTVKLADFGLSINHLQERPVTRAGTLDMMAPEVLVCPEKSRPEENKERAMLEYTNGVDAWAIGVVAFELMVGHPPFERESRSETYEHIMYRAPVMPACLSEDAKSFITSALIKAVSKRPSVDQLLLHPWLHIYRKASTDVREVVLEGAFEDKPMPSLPSLSITVDCTTGRNSSTAAASNASQESTSTRAEVYTHSAAMQPGEEQKPSVLQWAGSSLRTITKKLRKPAQQGVVEAPAAPPCESVAAAEAVSEALAAQTDQRLAQNSIARAVVPELAVEIASAAQEATALPQPLASPFSASASARQQPAAASPHLAGSVRQAARLGALPPSSAATAHRTPPRPAPLQLSHSLANLVVGTDRSEEAAQHRRSLIATQYGLEAMPPSPPAYLTRPWMQAPFARPSSELQTASPPVLHTPSPLARRRRRIAGAMDLSSSGSWNLADTPKGGHFPSGARSARSFGRAQPSKGSRPGSPAKRMTGEGHHKDLRSQSSATMPRSTQWAKLSLTHGKSMPRLDQAFATTPRKISANLGGDYFSMSPKPSKLSVARKLSLQPLHSASLQQRRD